MGVGGGVSRANVPLMIEWVGGAVTDFDGVTDVKITDSTGCVVTDARLCSHNNAPRQVRTSLIFEVLKDD